MWNLNLNYNWSFDIPDKF